MDFYGFIFNGISSEEMGIVVQTLPPISRADERVEKVNIPGRSGHLTYLENAYDSYTKSVEFTITDNYTDNIINWLKGSGEVIFGNQYDRYYKARVSNKFDLTDLLPILHKGIVMFDVQPFGYLVSGKDKITITSNNSYINNTGTIESKPYMKIYGTGNVTLSVNDRQAFSVTGLTDYIEVDSELDIFYRDTLPKENIVNGNVPLLELGKNKISFTGNVTKIEIIPRWCCL